jgi:hypothetical protein
MYRLTCRTVRARLVALGASLTIAAWAPPGLAQAPPAKKSRPAADQLLGVSTIDDVLYRIDSATGRARAVGKMGLGGVEALEYDADGRLIGAFWDGTPSLFRVDVQTGKGRKVATIQGSIVKYKVVEGLANVDGVLYGSASADDSYSGDCANHLIRIDPRSGKAVEVGAFGPEFLNIEALAYSPKHGLLGADIGTLVPPDYKTFHTRPALVRIDPKTGKATKIGDLPPAGVKLVGNPFNAFLSPEGPFVCGMDFGPDGTLYATTFPTHFGGDSDLVRIDPATGKVAPIGPTGAKHIDGLLYFSPLKLVPAAPSRPRGATVK